MTGTNDQPLIDIHLHLAGNGCCGSGCWLSPETEKRLSFRFLKLLNGITREQMETRIDGDWAKRMHELVTSSRAGFGVALGFDGAYGHESGLKVQDKSQLIVPPEWVFRVCREHPGLLPGPSINPFRQDALDLLDYCIEEGAVLLKWLPTAQGIDPDSPRIKRFYQKLADHRIPLLVHMGGERTFREIDPRYNDVNLLHRPLEAGVRTIIAHSATPIALSGERDQIPLLVDLLERYEHCYVDNSGMCNPARFIHMRRLVRHPLIQSRTLYGSDWPVPSNAWYFLPWLGPLRIRRIESISNLIDRDLAIKEAMGYDPGTHQLAWQVLANLDRWTVKGAVS